LQARVVMQVHNFFRNHLCSELVSLTRLSGDGVAQKLDGNLEEIGEFSALILTQAPVSPGTKIRVSGKVHALHGFVRSCTFDRLLGFFVEIGLDEESRWTEKWFRPEHLLSLCPSMRCFTETVPKVPEKFLLAKAAH
jgi:hypothetical protein